MSAEGCIGSTDNKHICNMTTYFLIEFPILAIFKIMFIAICIFINFHHWDGGSSLRRRGALGGQMVDIFVTARKVA